MNKLDIKQIIIQNGINIIANIEEIKYPRWSEFIERRIETYLSAAYSSFKLRDHSLTEKLTQRIIELEIIKNFPLIAFGIEKVSLNEMIDKCNFKYSKSVYFNDNTGEISGYVELKNKDRIVSRKASYFIPNWLEYNEVVATHYSKALTRNDVIELVSASMFFAEFNDNEIRETLSKIFNYTGKIPSYEKIKYVAIVWGSFDENNRATLSIPYEEMEYNDPSGNYRIYFARANSQDVEIHNNTTFIDRYSESLNDNTPSLYLVDNYYAIFA